MKSICLYFQVHQPYRLSNFSFFPEENSPDYFSGPHQFENATIFHKVATKCYLPTTNLLLKLLAKYPEFKVSFSLSGVFLDQCLEYGEIGKQVLDNFKRLAAFPSCELLNETYYHSLSFLYSKLEFAEQIKLHHQKIKKLFGVTPKIFRNTELIYNNEIASFIKELGFRGILAEGWDYVLNGKSPHGVMQPELTPLHAEDQKIARKYRLWSKPNEEFALLLKNYRLSDDIAFRFGNKSWKEYPLTTDKFANWVDQIYGETINLFMDFETFGEHQWEDTGIFQFLEHLPPAILNKNISFKTPSGTIQSYPKRDQFNCPNYLSWADMERNLSAWVDNDLQKSALQELKGVEGLLHPARKSRKKIFKKLWENFRKLQTSDHLYYMSTKYWSDGDVHTYFSPYESPYEAYINFMNIITDLKTHIKTTCPLMNPVPSAPITLQP